LPRTSLAGQKLSFALAQIELTPRLMNEQRPAIGANQKRHRNGRPMRCQERGKLAVDHRIE